MVSLVIPWLQDALSSSEITSQMANKIAKALKLLRAYRDLLNSDADTLINVIKSMTVQAMVHVTNAYFHAQIKSYTVKTLFWYICIYCNYTNTKLELIHAYLGIQPRTELGSCFNRGSHFDQ